MHENRAAAVNGLLGYVLMCVSLTVLLCAGGRDHEGCPILQLSQPKSLQEQMLRELTQKGILDMLIYFTSVPRFVIGTTQFCVVPFVAVHHFLRESIHKHIGSAEKL